MKDELLVGDPQRRALIALQAYINDSWVIPALRPSMIKDSSKRKRTLDALGLIYGNQCFWCNREMNRTHGSKLERTIEHLIPRQYGGLNARFNLVLACAKCNNNRDNRKTLPRVLEYYGLTQKDVDMLSMSQDDSEPPTE